MTQCYCIRGGEILGALCRSSGGRSSIFEFCRYLSENRVPGRWRIATMPGLLGRLIRVDPWSLWMTISVEQATERVAEWQKYRR